MKKQIKNNFVTIINLLSAELVRFSIFNHKSEIAGEGEREERNLKIFRNIEKKIFKNEMNNFSKEERGGRGREGEKETMKKLKENE